MAPCRPRLPTGLRRSANAHEQHPHPPSTSIPRVPRPIPPSPPTQPRGPARPAGSWQEPELCVARSRYATGVQRAGRGVSGESPALASSRWPTLSYRQGPTPRRLGEDRVVAAAWGQTRRALEVALAMPSWIRGIQRRGSRAVCIPKRRRRRFRPHPRRHTRSPTKPTPWLLKPCRRRPRRAGQPPRRVCGPMRIPRREVRCLLRPSPNTPSSVRRRTSSPRIRFSDSSRSLNRRLQQPRMPIVSNCSPSSSLTSPGYGVRDTTRPLGPWGPKSSTSRGTCSGLCDQGVTQIRPRPANGHRRCPSRDPTGIRSARSWVETRRRNPIQHRHLQNFPAHQPHRQPAVPTGSSPTSCRPCLRF